METWSIFLQDQRPRPPLILTTGLTTSCLVPKGTTDSPEAKQGALIEVSKKNQNIYQIVSLRRSNKCGQSQSVVNAPKRAEEAEKEKRRPIIFRSTSKTPTQSGRPHAINDRQQRSLIRHATKNKFQPEKCEACKLCWEPDVIGLD